MTQFRATLLISAYAVLRPSSYATNLVPGDNGAAHIFVYDRQRMLERVWSRPLTATLHVALSAGGRYVAYASAAKAGLVNGDANGAVDIFVHDRLACYTQVEACWQ